ncbi:MAG: PAS domain-containing protein, partial [Sphingobacteriaceae bacterium]|nr:PAS domain-containing protein [Cytophagaceae bacterium]
MQPVPGEEFMAGGGQMGALIRNFDWASSPIGPVAGWPQSLRTSVSVCLHSRFPMLIWWGPEPVKIYNDAYRPLIGTKQALGRAGRLVWPENWDFVGPMLAGVLDRGEATWSEDQLLLLNRHPYLEEAYFTFSYSPIHDESGGIGGVFCAVIETTQQVLRERRSKTLRDLAQRVAGVETGEAALEKLFLALHENPHDVPFALFYRPDEAGTGLQLAAHLRDEGLRTDETAWPLAELSRTGQAQLLDEIPFSEESRLNPPSEPVRQAYALPVAQPGLSRPGREQPFGWLVLGVNPRRAFDDEQRYFFESLAGSAALAFATVTALDAERRRAETLIEIERAKAEAWQQAEARLQNLFMQAPVVLAILGREPHFIFQMANQAYADIVDRRMDEILGKPLSQALPEVRGQGFDDLLTQVMTTGIPYVSTETPARVIQGGQLRTIYLNFMYYPLREPGGAVTGVMVVATDVTEQVEARNKMEESSRVLNAMFSQTPLGIATLQGPEFVIELANPAICQFWGRTHVQVNKKPLFEALPEVAGQGFEEMLAGVLQTGQPYIGTELPATLERDGQLDTVYFDFVYEPLREADGRIERILIVATDSTEKVLARRARKESEVQLNRVFEQAPVAIAIARGDQYVIQLVNPGMCEFWNRTQEQLLGNPIFDVIPEAAGQGFEELLQGVMQTGIRVTGTEVPVTLIRRGVPTVVYVNFLYEPLREADGRISGIIAMAIDVSGQVENRRKIEESEARFRQMAETMPEKVWTAEANGNINHCNQRALDYTGLTFQELKDWGWGPVI